MLMSIYVTGDLYVYNALCIQDNVIASVTLSLLYRPNYQTNANMEYVFVF